MSKKLKIRTPQTTDGVNLKYDANKQVVYKESIVEPGARKNIEALNVRRAPHLKHIIEEIDVPDAPTSASNSQIKEKLDKILAQKENIELTNKLADAEKELDELKTKLAEKEAAGGPTSDGDKVVSTEGTGAVVVDNKAKEEGTGKPTKPPKEEK